MTELMLTYFLARILCICQTRFFITNWM